MGHTYKSAGMVAQLLGQMWAALVMCIEHQMCLQAMKERMARLASSLNLPTSAGDFSKLP